MTNSIFDCLVTQRNILENNKNKLLKYFSKIASQYEVLKKSYNFEYLLIVNHETKFFQSVSIVDSNEEWTTLEDFDENFSNGEAFGLWDHEFKNNSDPIPDFMWNALSLQLNHIFSLWILNVAKISDLKKLSDPIFYSLMDTLKIYGT